MEEIYVPLITPFKTALRTVYTVEDIVVKIQTDEGLIGYGEAAPTAVITGDTKGSILTAINNFIKPNIIGMSITDFDTIMFKLNSCLQRNYSAKAAVDMALYDLFSQYLKIPLYKLLGGNKEVLYTDITISLNDVNEMVQDSLTAVANGFNILKVKLGNNQKLDLERIKNIRNAVGNEVVLRVDANQGWQVKEAIRFIRAMEDLNLDIELVEQPVKYDDILGLKTVTSSTCTNILADESVFTAKDAINIIQNHVADMINIKLMKTGGIYNALKIISMAEVYDVQCMIGCMLESKISVTAAAHLGCGKKAITLADLDGPYLCKNDPIRGGAIFQNNTITMSTNWGLGFN